MGNNSNSRNASEDFKLSKNEVVLLKREWNDLLNIGLAELGVGLMTR